MSTQDFIEHIKHSSKGFNLKDILSKLIFDVEEIDREISNSMYSEILEQPEIIEKLANQYLPIDKPVQGININLTNEEIKHISKVYIVASGSSRNVGNITKYFMSNIAGLSVITDYASEFAHKDPPLNKNDLVIAISQSGETADTYLALKVAKEKGAYTLALTNNPDSRIHTLARFKMQIGAGKEKSIAATKSFTGQLINLFALALYLGEKRDYISTEESKEIKQELHVVPEKMKKIFKQIDNIEKIAKKIKNSKSIVLLGRGLNYAVAREGALKIKETSYIDANGYPSGEFLHGHMAFVDSSVPVVSIIVKNKDNETNYKLAISNTEEVKNKRNPNLIIIKSEKDKTIKSKPAFKNADFIEVPDSMEQISPFYTTICLQLLALKIAEALGRDIDNPRSLTKALTTE